jgi:hypothetical protein
MTLRARCDTRFPREDGDGNEGISRRALLVSFVGAVGVVLLFLNSMINPQFHTRWIQVFIRSTLICINRAQAPCALGDEVVFLKIYKGSRVRKTKYRVFGRVCSQVTSCYDEGVAQDNGYVLHSVPRHHFPPRHEEQKVGGPRSA